MKPTSTTHDQEMPQLPVAAPNGSTRVLFVDDDPRMRAMASTILHALGWQVFQAGSGEEATMLFKFCSEREMPVAVVIMDIVLPGGMSGIEAMHELRVLDPKVQVIASSGFFECDSPEDCRALGFADMLPKPYSLQDLSNTLNRCQSEYNGSDLALAQ